MARDNVARQHHTQTHAQIHRERKERLVSHRAGPESDTMFSWYNMMKVNWNALSWTATEGTSSLRWSFLSMKKSGFVCMCVAYNFNWSCWEFCCHVGINRLSDLKLWSNCRTVKDFCKSASSECRSISGQRRPFPIPPFPFSTFIILLYCTPPS